MLDHSGSNGRTEGLWRGVLQDGGAWSAMLGRPSRMCPAAWYIEQIMQLKQGRDGRRKVFKGLVTFPVRPLLTWVLLELGEAQAQDITPVAVNKLLLPAVDKPLLL